MACSTAWIVCGSRSMVCTITPRASGHSQRPRTMSRTYSVPSSAIATAALAV